jgi:uncharacterized membrane protein
MSMTAWRFRSTEGADDAVVRLKTLNAQDMIDVQDIAVVRWPQYATSPQAAEHVIGENSKMTSMMNKIIKGNDPKIDPSMIESVRGDMEPGTSALVLKSSAAMVETVAKAFRDQPMELMRSDLSVKDQDQLRTLFGDPNGPAGNQPTA